MSVFVKGYCPSCGSPNLFVGEGGYLTCARLDCKEPTALSDILDDRETEHLVHYDGEGGFVVRHPLIERLGDRLMECGVLAYLVEGGVLGMALNKGTYRAVPYDGVDYPSWTLAREPE